MLLPASYLPAIVFLRQDQVGLHPGDPASREKEKIGDAVGTDAAVLIELLAPFMSDGLNAALHGDAVRAAKEIERLFTPQIDARLQADLYSSLRQSFQQRPRILAGAEDFVDEVDVLHAARDQSVHFGKYSVDSALAKFVAKEGLVAEGA